MIISALSLLLAASPVVEVALLSTAPSIDTLETTELRFQPLSAAELSPVAARFAHVPQATVLGAVVPGTRKVLITVTTVPSKDLSWASSLVLLEEGKDAVVLADRVAVSTRPLITAEGRVFVQRGKAGRETGESLRVDEISIDEVNLRTRALRTVYRFSGMTAFLAGAQGRELFVYQVGAKRTDLVSVHADTLAVRTLLGDMVPLARDFVVDGQRLLFTQGNPVTGAWEVASLELRSLERSTLFVGDSMALLPTVLPGGLAVQKVQGRGLINAATGAQMLRSQGDGYERVRALSNGVAIGLHERPSDFPLPLAVDLRSGEAVKLAAPANARLDVAGAVSR